MLRGHNIDDTLLDYPDKLYGKIFFDKYVTPLSDGEYKELFDFLWFRNGLPDKLNSDLPVSLKEKIIEKREKLNTVMGYIVKGEIKGNALTLLKMVLKDELSDDKAVWESYLDSIETFQNKKGGIDFAALPIQTESVASFASGYFPAANVFKGDLDSEWAQIQAVFNSGVRPSIQRISEYTIAAASSHMAGEEISQVRDMLIDILRSEEEDYELTFTDPALKVLFSALEA